MMGNISDKEKRAIDWNLAYLKGERPYACLSISSIDHLEKLFEEDNKKIEKFIEREGEKHGV